MDLHDFTNEELLEELRQRRGYTLQDKLGGFLELEDQLKDLSQKLREAERGKCAFLSNVRNELNNPLSSMLGLAASITHRATDPQLKQIGDLMLRQALELDYQMRNIILATEIESGEIHPQAVRVDVRSLLESQVAYLLPRIQSAGVQIDLKMALDPLPFVTDAGLLQAICLNMLANAVEFSPPSANVVVNAWTADDRLHICVQDSGAGIEPEKQTIIFDWFRQLDEGAAKAHHGQGLGLAIVSELTEMLGGYLQLDSVKDAGTTIALQIPPLEFDKLPAGTSSYGNEVLFEDMKEF